MSTDGFEHVSRIDAPAIVRAMVASGGPAVQLVKALGEHRVDEQPSTPVHERVVLQLTNQMQAATTL